MNRFPALFLSAAVLLLAACSTSEDYLPPAYSCDCGTLVLDGDSLEVLGAEYVYLPGEDSLFSRRYFVTADAKTDGELKEHGVSLTLDVPNVQQGAIFYPDSGVFTQVDETNFNVNFDTTQTFRITNGVASVVAAPIDGGEESVALDFLIRRELDGELVGFERTLKGNFAVQVD
tara:strand:- start:1233 stop:1754 length:522 start_codon:yes stop_codon:yes gene_type:complete